MAKSKKKPTKKGRVGGKKRGRRKKIPVYTVPHPSLARPPIVVKIALFAAVFYVLAISLYLVGEGFLNSTAGWLGLSTELVIWGAEILLLALILVVAIQIFLGGPIRRLREIIGEVVRGDFLARADVGDDEIGELADDLNQLFAKMTDLNAEKMQTEYELLLAREELKYKSRLEKRGDRMAKTNIRLESLVRDLSLLYEIGQRVNSTIQMDELYRVIQEALATRLELQKFAILLVDEKREFLNVKAAYGFEDTERVNELAFRLGEGISGEVASKGDLIYVPDVEVERRFLHYQGESVEKGAFLSIPLRCKRDILGVVNFSRVRKNSFSEDEIRLLTLVAGQIALAVENAKLYTKTRELSVRDELTRVYNRRHFGHVLQLEWKRATRFKRPLSLLMIDIDHFKAFNDTFGHPLGDRVLKTIADLLNRNLREVDTVARFGGEEFVVLLPDTDRTGAMVAAEKLRLLVETERFEDQQRRIMPLTISIGVSAFPDDVREMDDLIDHSDVALYEAKDGGRNRVVHYLGTSGFLESVERKDISVS